MFVILGALLGIVTGGLIAKRRSGKRLDILQYAAMYGIAFSIVGLFITIIVHRMSV